MATLYNFESQYEAQLITSVLFSTPELQGITKQSTIGFLTQLEHLRYCEVRANVYLNHIRSSISYLNIKRNTCVTTCFI